jgi:hypothetical protein
MRCGHHFPWCALALKANARNRQLTPSRLLIFPIFSFPLLQILIAKRIRIIGICSLSQKTESNVNQYSTNEGKVITQAIDVCRVSGEDKWIVEI